MDCPAGRSQNGAVKYRIANALEKLGLANRSELRHWHRAPNASALKDKPMNAAWTMGPIAQIARSVQDIKQAEDWYRRVLGLPHLYTFGKLAFFGLRRNAADVEPRVDAGSGIPSLKAGRQHCRRVRALEISGGRIHQCAAHDSSARRRYRGMAVNTQRSGRPAAWAYGASEILGAKRR